MIKKGEFDVEGRLKVAERVYDRMLANVNQGIIDKEEIVRAMDEINIAHKICLKYGRTDLIDKPNYFS